MLHLPTYTDVNDYIELVNIFSKIKDKNDCYIIDSKDRVFSVREYLDSPVYLNYPVSLVVMKMIDIE